MFLLWGMSDPSNYEDTEFEDSFDDEFDELED